MHDQFCQLTSCQQLRGHVCDCAVGVDIHRLAAHSPAEAEVCHLGTKAPLIHIAVAQQDIAPSEVTM